MLFTFCHKDGVICISEVIALLRVCLYAIFFSSRYRATIFIDPWLVESMDRWCSGKESTGQCRRLRRLGFNPWVRNIPWRRKWQPAPVFLPGKLQGQRSLAGYSPWDRRESDVAELTHTHRGLICLFFIFNPITPGNRSKKYCCNMSESVLPVFSSRSFMVIWSCI